MSTQRTARGKFHGLMAVWVFGIVGIFHQLGIVFDILKKETPEGVRRLFQDHETAATVLIAFVLGLVLGFALQKVGPKLLRLLRVRHLLTQVLKVLPDDDRPQGS